MSWKIQFKPNPRCLRDKLELWFVGLDNGRFYYATLAGLIPFLAVPVGLVLGLIITFLINPDVNAGWHLPERYVPVLLCPGVAVVIGRIIAGAIIDGYYLDNSPFHNNRKAIDRIIADSRRKPRRKRPRPRDRFDDDDE